MTRQHLACAHCTEPLVPDRLFELLGRLFCEPCFDEELRAKIAAERFPERESGFYPRATTSRRRVSA